MTEITRDSCQDWDAGDPLAPLREEFELPEDIIYLDGNSLGPLPKGVARRLERLISHEWGRDLIKSWNQHDWISLPRRVGAKIAALIGAHGDEVVAADSTSINLFKLVAGALKMKPERSVILTEHDNFPTDIYILEGLCDLLGGAIELRFAAADEITAAIDNDVAVVVLTHVNYKTGAIHDMEGITRAAHDGGALMLWDLCHTAGAMAVDIGAAKVDLAVGCGYKFLNGGPGAPAYLYVARSLQEELRQPLTGWLGHAAPFAFDSQYRPAPGIDRNVCGTPTILSLAALDVSLDIFARADMAAVRQKSRQLGDLFVSLIDGVDAGHGLTLACPRDSGERGSQVSLRHPEGYAIMQALIDQGVIGDFRAPDILRFGLTPLYLRFVDIWDAAAILDDIMTERSWDRPEYHDRKAVT